MSIDSQTQNTESAIFDDDIVIDDDVAEVRVEAPGTSDTEAVETDKESEPGKEAAVPPQDEQSESDAESEGVEAQAPATEDSQAGDDTTHEDPTKAFRDKYSRERAQRLQMQRSMQRHLQSQVDDGAEIEDLAQSMGMSEKQVQDILDDTNLAALDSANPIEAKGQELVEAIQFSPRTANQLVAATLGADTKLEDIAYNVSALASRDEAFRDELLGTPKGDLLPLFIDKYKELRDNGLTMSMNPMDDVQALRSELQALKAENAALKAKPGTATDESKGADAEATPPIKVADEDDRPRMSDRAGTIDDGEVDFNEPVEIGSGESGVFG